MVVETINNSVIQIKKNFIQLKKQNVIKLKNFAICIWHIFHTQIHFSHDDSMASDLVESNRKYLIFLAWITKNVPLQSGEQKPCWRWTNVLEHIFFVVHDKNQKKGRRKEISQTPEVSVTPDRNVFHKYNYWNFAHIATLLIWTKNTLRVDCKRLSFEIMALETNHFSNGKFR